MTIIRPSRRGFLTGFASLIAAPAIVRVGSLMPVKALPAFSSMRGLIDYVPYAGEITRLDVLCSRLFIRPEWTNVQIFADSVEFMTQQDDND